MAIHTDGQRITDRDFDQRDSQQIRRDIEHTRHEMDATLEELGERLHPKRLLDYVMDFVRSSSAQASADEVGMKLRSTASEVASKLKKHPIPAALMGAALTWLAFEQPDEEQKLEPMRGSRRMPEPGRPAWDPKYDWSRSKDDEQSWTSRASQIIERIKASISDTSQTPAQKIRGASSSIMELSGMSRNQIREAIHARWADLREHSGSYVDARTGQPYGSQPYDQAAGEDWENLCGVGCLLESDAEDEGWGEKASEVLDDIKKSLSEGRDNARDVVRDVAAKLGSFGNTVGQSSKEWGQRVAHGARDMWQRTSSRTEQLSGRAKEIGTHTQQRIGEGYRQSRDRLQQEMDEHPLAVGAAALGIGLLAGFVLPRTRSEDRLMGAAADDVRDQAIKKGEEAIDRGEQIAERTAQSVKQEVQQHVAGDRSSGDRREAETESKMTPEQGTQGKSCPT